MNALRYFYDCEFLEDGKTIELISIGMVAEDGRELYLVSEEIDNHPLHERICGHHWLMENVVPHLPLATRRDGTPWVNTPGPENVYPQQKGSFTLDPADNRITSRRFIRNAVRDFIAAGGPSREQHELWAYYGAYDHVALCQLFGRMVDLPECIPMFTHDLMQLHNLEMVTSLVPQQAEHSAIHDARWNRDVYLKWKGLSRS